MHIQGTRLVDEEGRTLLWRGVNLAGSSKVPYTPQVEAADPRFFEHRTVSFVGRPFPLAEADEHFLRLRRWGFTFLRLLVTWEAVAHAGPCEFDEEYLEYLRAIVTKAGEHGFQVVIDPHQDVWSRFTGGDGAPGWTLEAVGFDLTRMTATGAALLDHTHTRRPRLLVWATNYARLAPATMFTLFYAGNDFAPKTKIEGVSAQEYLQSHYLAAMTRVAEALRGLSNVVGYEVMNEPSRGYIGWRNLKSAGQYIYHPTPSPFKAMLLGAGFGQRVWQRWWNTEQVRVWQEGREDVWRENGVWDADARGKPQLLRPEHFVRVNGREVEFRKDYYPPFAKRFAEALHAVDPKALIFVEGEPGELPPALTVEDLPNMVYAPHWYDTITLIARRYLNHIGVDMLRRRLVLGAGAIQRSFAAQLGVFQYDAAHTLGGVPVHLGEFGVPFDLIDRSRRGAVDEFLTTRALDRSFRALEANLMNGTIWNYSPDNTREKGDSFNGEDLSIFSRSEQKGATTHGTADLDVGGRALRAVARPYPRATAGELLRLRYDWLTRSFECELKSNSAVSAPTEIVVPAAAYPAGFEVQVSDGTYTWDEREGVLRYEADRKQELHAVRITPKVLKSTA